MLAELSARLQEVIEKRRLRNKIEGDLQLVEHKLDLEMARLETLEANFSKEKIDVEKLERMSLTGLFYSVLGSREEQLARERQELLAAQLKYQQAKYLVEALKGDREALQRQLQAFAGIDRQYDALLAEKERLLRESGRLAARELVELAEQSARLQAEVNELEEAILAGNSVVGGLEQAIQALQSAEGWGTWDMLGGGLISTMVKHSRIDEARAAIHEVQAQMDRFQRELADVRSSAQLEIEIGAFESFADYFFDSLIVDWIVQSKIASSLDHAVDAMKRVAQVVNDLRSAKSRASAEIAALDARRKEIIENG